MNRANSYHFQPDATRAASWVAPLSVTTGRGIVDATGRIVARAVAGETMTEDGAHIACGFSPTEADANAHALALQLNAEPCAAFLKHCQEEQRNAATATAGEFWQRLAGSVRKAATL